MSNFSFRAAVESDLPELASMYAELNRYYAQVGYQLPQPNNIGELWLESFRRTLGRFSNVFLAEMDRQNIGFVLCRVKRLPAHMGGLLVGEISDVWVNSDIRQKGVGLQLLNLAIEWLRSQGCHSIEAQILKDNTASWKLFERMGFLPELTSVRLTLETDA